LTGCLQSFPDRNIPSNIDLVVDGYDVVDAGDYPPDSKLRAGAEGSYDVIMLTGSSTFLLSPFSLDPDDQNTLHTILPTHSSLP
jgi:hypothetical protein